MKGFLRILFAGAVIAAGLALTSCGKPRIIPDDKLAIIFHDVYLTNAYTQSSHIRLDSLNIYEPVLKRYGYTAEDFQFTVGSFAKRKSAKLSDVVDTAVELLRAENDFYKGRVAIYDTIGTIAREKFASVVYTDTLIRVSRIADTSRLRIVIPVEGSGIYEVSYSYKVDSTDRNSNLKVNHYLLDENRRQSGSNSRRLRKDEREYLKMDFEAGERHRKLVLDLNPYPKDMTKPSLGIDTLVVRYLLPDRVARDSMGRSFFRYALLDTLANPLRNAASGDPPYIILPEEPAPQKPTTQEPEPLSGQ